MGNSLNSGKGEEKRRSKLIDKVLQEEGEKIKDDIKMLILGAGQSGKSTVLKQFKVIHARDQIEEDQTPFREIIYANTVQFIKIMVQEMKNLNISFCEEMNQQYGNMLLKINPKTLSSDDDSQNFRDSNGLIAIELFPPDLAKAIKSLWADQGVQACYARRNEYQLDDSAKYFFEELDRIYGCNYKPSLKDIIHTRIPTTGIKDTQVRINDINYRIIDVGGQRSQREKWIQCFDSVTAVVFVVALSEYDQVLDEDKTINRMQESLNIFEEICNHPSFKNSSLILFLNKMDLFEEKLAQSPLEKYFPDYKGGKDFKAAKDYILSKYLSRNRSSKQIYSHFTCATDTSQIKFVISAVHITIIQNNLKQLGVLKI